MTNIQLPVSVTDLFSVFGVTDPARMLIILLSLVLGVLLVLIMLIAFRGRSSGSNLSNQKGEAADSSRAKTLAPEPIISKSTQPEESDALAAQRPNIIENSELASEQVEDFQIFKRPRQKSTPADQTAPSLDVKDPISTADHLRLIEQEMVRLRGLYQGGHITRDMYIDETRSLYLQARELSSIS
ncbi:MAG: hypothetical protein CM15mP100_4220 [Alphaproteobacteria bacterium]|nr:MAG: hypothetical protein CM15mP100_4220 [Alphaproteobacteria bacterium]